MNIKYSLLATAIAFTPYIVNAEAIDLNDKIDVLSKEIAELKAQVAQNPAPKIKGKTFSIYGSLRPNIEYRNDKNNADGDGYFDQHDGLSQLGFKGDVKINDNMSAFFKGEWAVDIQDGGAFGRPRQVFAGLATSWGTVGIGKQRPSQYLYIGGYVDIFNHASSGNFGLSYDKDGAFFIDNSFTYQKKFDNISVHAIAKFDGRNGKNNTDLVNYGIAYDYNDLHLGLTYLDKTSANGLNAADTTEIISFSAAYSIGDLYLALAYQDLTKTAFGATQSEDNTTTDIVAAYKLPKNFKVKAGYFKSDYDVTINGDGYTGYNLTLENQLTSNAKVHIEYVSRDLDNVADYTMINVGVTYDFNLGF